MGINDLSCTQWDNTFGRVYQELIDDGVMTIMAGHIALPSYQRKLHPGLKNEEILPATLSPELITGLLKEKMQFHGLVVTDASHMIGMFAAMPRKEQVPRAIAAGCDCFLFFNDPEEDFGYMLEGYRSGIITEERLKDALYRILGVKAAIGLHRKQAEGTLMPPREALEVVGCRELNISGIDTSFVLFPDQEGRVILSARSMGDVNVQVVLEKLGGGGNAATAGAQVPGKGVDEVNDMLLQAIDAYLEEE